MATCPRCLGPLDDDHRCLGRLARARGPLAAIAVGGTAGSLMVFAVEARPAAALIMAAAALGAVVAHALRSAVNPPT